MRRNQINNTQGVLFFGLCILILTLALILTAQGKDMNSKINASGETDFGPILGQPIIRKRPTPGKYSGTFQFSIDKLLTRESTLSQFIKGNAIINLSEEYTVDACFAVHSENNSSQSKYITADGKDHFYTQEERFLMAASGKWSANDETFTLELTKSWDDSCLNRDDSKAEAIHLKLDCVSILKNDRLPGTVLACKLLTNHSFVNKITLNPADLPRAGPFTFQTVATRQRFYDTGDRWLFLGAEPGLKITSIESRRTSKPDIIFTQTPVIIREKEFHKRAK